MKVLVLDNYDSFTFNLVQMIGARGLRPVVARNDALTCADIAKLAPDRIVLSPGPGHPEDPRYFGVCREVLRILSPRIPTLGVCLGHQGIATAYGARVVRGAPVHGKTADVVHDGSALFRGMPPAFPAMRYHSLVVDPTSLPHELAVTARTDDGVIMAIAHRELPIVGVQFHPESIGTPDGATLLGNFLGQRT